MLSWVPIIVGEDIVIENVTASFWGGANDPEDDGSTASGISTKGNPDFIGVSLPMPTSNGKPVPTCADSPLPSMPYLKTFIELTGPGGVIYAPLIDVGPETKTGHLPDLTKRAFQLVGGNFVRGLVQLPKVRIIGAAKYLKAVAS